MAVTLLQAQAQLDAWLEASTKVAQGQSYTIGSRSLTRAHAAEILKNISYWEGRVVALTNSSGTGGARVRYGMPGS